MLYTDNDVKRFWEKTRRDDSGCVLWTAARRGRGYGAFGHKYNGKKVVTDAHRWIVSVHEGRKLDRLEYVLHSCDNPPCVNLAHLRIGSPSDNMRDAVERGRHVSPGTLKTHCPQGHPYAGDNLVVTTNEGYVHRQCRTCMRRQWHVWKARHEARKGAP